MIATSKSSQARASKYSKFLSVWGRPKAATRQHRDLCLITQFFPPDYAATGQLLEELTHHLGQQGMHIQVFTGQPGYAFGEAHAPAQERKGRLKIQRSRITQLWPQRIRGKAMGGVLFFLRACLYMLRRGWQQQVLLLTTAPPFLPLLGYLANIIFGLSYICVLYDLYPDIAVELGVVSQHHWVAKCWQWLNRQVWLRADQLIVLSPAMKTRIVAQCPSIAHKVSVIHSWADTNAVVPVEKTQNWFAQQHDLVEPFTVLYSGNMGRCHDVDTLLDAAQQLRQEPIKFVCIGGGAKRGQLEADVQALGLKNFSFLPYQAKADLPYSLTACDVSLVSVSPDMASLVAPSKLYPALSAGRPVAAICPQGAYLRDLIHDARCGETFLNGDGVGLAQFIRRLAADRSLVHKMGQASREYVQANFTIDVIAKQYMQVLTPLLKLV